jgi:DNA-binding GntR family transcriptional regulator
MAGIDGLFALEDRPTSELIADQIREGILQGAFRPGEQVVEAQLAARMQVSRGPVREALQRLIQEGLLVSYRNMGVFVLELTASDIAEIYAARKAIETAAADAVLKSGKAAISTTVTALRRVLGDMAGAVGTGDWSRLAELDLAFHSTLVGASGNSRLSRIYTTLAAESRICLAGLEDSYARIDALVKEHERIVDFLAEERGQALREEIERHMDKAVADLSIRVPHQDPRDDRAASR